MKRILFHFHSALAAVFIAAASLSADPQPDSVKVTTPIYQRSYSEFTPQFGKYTYTVSWQGIPAATATITVMPDGLYFKNIATAQTWSGIDLLYRLRYRAEGLISAIDFLPVRTEIEQRENSNYKYTRIEFKGDGGVYSFRKANKEEPKQLSFNPNNLMLDPFSAAFLARSLHWELGETKSFDLFNGKSRYLIELTAASKETVEFGGEEKDVWVISPKVTNLTNQQQTKKLREAKIYVTADQKREVVKVVSKVFIGSVTTELDSFEPFDARPGMAVASVHDGRTFFK